MLSKFKNLSFENLFFILILLFGIVLMLWGVNKPFVGLYNLNNNQLYWGASNYLQFGYLKLHLLPTYFEGQILPNPIPYYLHHPVLMYLIVSVAIKVFGFGNWVVHLVPLLFSIGSIAFLYKIATFAWNKKVAVLASISAFLFPMFNFFWKMSVFEHVSLFFLLWIVYLLLLYLRNKTRIYLMYIFLLSILAGLIDWGGAYLVAPFALVLLLNSDRKKLIAPFALYFLGIFISLSVFVVGVFLATHNLKELIDAILNRSVSSELFALSFWPIRLIFITLIRIILYFSPLVILSFLVFRQMSKFNPTQALVLLIFLILGLENIFVLPSATWGHSFLMFYFIPFFALTSALFLSKIRNKKVLFLTISVLLLFSFFINYLKNLQIDKQLWKYNAAASFNQKIMPLEKISTNNFPGEIFATYFNHETIQIPFNDIPQWLVRQKDYGVDFLVLPCNLSCGSGELDVASKAKDYGDLYVYKEGDNTAFLLERSKTKKELHLDKPLTKSNFTTQKSREKVSKILNIYRFLRNFISAYQI